MKLIYYPPPPPSWSIKEKIFNGFCLAVCSRLQSHCPLTPRPDPGDRRINFYKPSEDTRSRVSLFFLTPLLSELPSMPSTLINSAPGKQPLYRYCIFRSKKKKYFRDKISFETYYLL